MEIKIRPATAADWPPVAALLQAAQLPLEGAQAHLSNFILAFQDNELLGCAGLEAYGESGLLRSVAVKETARGTGVGGQLVQAVLQAARGGGMRRVLLLTETAAHYFPRFGFQTITRAQAPQAVQASEEFTTACPASATVMMLDLCGAEHTPPHT
ncbi:MAG: GNAT family N-acetyltransferase [Anaerolineales bacterium]|nr:GNAT family N-acetyltransferase [Anaerolineales bacterium]